MVPLANAMRFKDSQEQKAYLRHASQAGNVELVYAGLDVLGSTPWKINRGVFDIVLKVWNSGERLCKVPPAVYDQPEPERPHNIETDIKAKSIYGMRLKTYAQDKANNHSDRCSVNYKIEIARAVSSALTYIEHLLMGLISSLVIHCICLTTLISVAVHTPYLHT